MPRVVDTDERRAELAGAAARLIARAGVGAATMRDVAAEAGLTTGALTHYFSDKRDLLLFTFRSSLAERHARREGLELPPRDDLLDSLEGALPVDEERRRHWMVTMAFCAQAGQDGELAAAQRDAYRAFRDRIARLTVEAGITDGAGSSSRAEQLIAVADGIAVQALFDAASWPAERQLATLRELLAPLLAVS
jgi:AcrR family transcriptional regulator